jgi:hypothetical protein
MVTVSKSLAFVAFAALLAITFSAANASRTLKFDASPEIPQFFNNDSQPPAAEVLVAATSSKNVDFVTVNGRQFYLDGRPWHCAGSNAYYAAITDRLTPEEVDTLFKVSSHAFSAALLPPCFLKLTDLSSPILFIQVHAEKGATVIRVFAHSDGASSTSNPIQPSLGVYNEDALKRLDLVLYSAAKYGIRLILPFTNFEPFLGGIQWYAEQVGGAGADKEIFYTDPKAKDAYISYVTMLLNRKNTLNNLHYKEDPTIFALELMNEPHTRDNWEKNRGLYPPGKIVGDWIRDMAKVVKGIDSRHILLTGEEVRHSLTIIA